MKKLILTQLLLLVLVLATKSQGIYVSPDSMNNAPNPGRYYLNLLEPNVQLTEADTIEGDEKHANARDYVYWLDRMPSGHIVDSPFYKYSHMMRYFTEGNCLPKAGDFNGNWVNTGPNTITQSQGRVYDVYAKPVPHPNLPTELWIGTGNAGLWKTTNGGGNWTCVSDTWSPSIHGAGIPAIAVNPFNPDEMYVSTLIQGGDRRNFMTWEYGQGVWHSTTGGNTWSIDLGGLSNFQAMDHMKFCPHQLNGGTNEMIIATQANRVYKKISGGNWIDITPASLISTPLPIREITFGPSGKFYISTQHNYVPPGQTFVGPRIFECTYNTNTGAVINWSVLLNDDNWGNMFVFSGVASAKALAFETGYAGNNQLYILVVAENAAPATEGHHSLYNYNMGTTALSLEYAMPFCNPTCRSVWRASAVVSPTNPNVVYVDGVRPQRLWKDATGWHQDEFPNTGGAFHDDNIRTHIYYSDPNGNFNNDIVYWGNDGGLTRTIGNAIANLNGDLITNEIYDVDVSQLRKKRAAASFDNGIHVNNSNNTWEFQSFGDGFNTIYEKRFDQMDVTLLAQGNSQWRWYTHGNSLGAANTFNQFPRRTTAGSIDLPRPFEFPHEFDSDYMFGGNRNILRSLPLGYGLNWDIMTTGGGLNGAASTVTDHCRAFAISPDLGNGPVGQRMYYGLRRPLPDATGNYKVFYARDFQGLWHDWTPTVIKNGSFNLTDIVIDDKDPTRVFISMGMVHWSMGPIASERVFRGDYDPIGNNMVWTDMSAGLTQLPVTCLAYQAGSDDIIYAGTDAGVYRYDKPLNCWVKFNGSSGGNPMPSVVVHDLVIDYCAGKIVMGSYSRGLWETDLYQLNQFPGPSTKIVSNETWGSTNPAIITNKIVKGSIVITSGNTLTIVGTNNTGNQNATSSNTTIYMPKWGQILIEKGGKLVVNGAHITNECDATWSGIFAYGHGAVPQTISPLNGLDPNHGWVLLDHAIISNAEEALNNGGGNNAPWPNTGGIIQVSKSHFINNHRSAAFYKYRNLMGVVLNADMSFIVGSRFDVDDNIRIPFYAHISNWGTSGIKIDQNEFNNTQNSTIDHREAIISIDAGYQFKYNSVNGFKNGLNASIFSYSYENLFPVNITKNTFDKNQIGIHLQNLTLPLIIDNNFKIGMRQDAGSGPYYSLGTKMENTSSFTYMYNTHKNDYGDPTFVYTAGTEVHNTGQNDENITQNSYEDLWIGNDGDYTCAYISNDIFGLKYTCNDNVDNLFYDFIFQANPYIRKYQNGSAMNIGAANTFTQSASMASWHQVTGGNGPVNYVYNQNVATEIPNGNSFNYTPNLQNLSECSNQFAFNIPKLDSCKNDELDSIELEYLKEQYYSNDSAFNIFSTLYAQLLDNGNTEELVEEVQNASVAEQLTTRADFLSISPYVSSDVLRELGTQEVVSNPIYLEILLANPDATNTENFLNFLTNELPNPLPEYMIDMIRASWTDAQTPRNLLEQNMSNYHNRMTVLKNHIIRTYIVNSELVNLDSAYEWKKLVPSIRNSYEIIEQNLYNGNVAGADSMLENINSQFRFAVSDEIEHEAFILLYNFKKSLIEDSIEIDELDSTKISILKGIAEAEEYTFPRRMARNVLCYFYQICYPDSVRELPSLSGKPIKNRTLRPKAEHVLVYPNPAKDFVVCYYDLSAKLNEASEILISDMTGKQVYRARLNGSIGQHIWDTRNIDLGNYIYTITTKSGEKYSGKILIQR